MTDGDDVTRVARPLRVVVACGVAAALCAIGVATPLSARERCTAFAPGADGVLRLDTGRGLAAPCVSPRWRRVASNAVPSDPLIGATPSKRPIVRHAAVETTSRLEDETVRLKSQVGRLSDEAARLRDETGRLKEQLARREPAQSSPADLGAKPTTDSKIEGKIAPTPPDVATTPLAPKGDLLTPAPRQTEIQKTSPQSPAGAKDAGKDPDLQRQFDQQKTVVERAWSQLLDLAGRMKNLSGRGE